MKILQLIQKEQFRGAELFACQLANELLHSGHDVVVVTVFEGVAELPFEGRMYCLKAGHGRRLFDFQAWKALSKLVKDFRPDIVQANAGDTLKYAVFSKVFFRWSSKLVFRNASTISQYLTNPLQKTLNKFLFGNVDFIVSVSVFSMNDFVRQFPSKANYTSVVPIAIFDAGPAVQAKQNSPGIQFLHVGGFSFEKNHFCLLDIFRKLLDKIPNASLHLVGDGPLREQVEKKVRDFGLQDRVVFHGFQKDPRIYYTSSDVLLLPSIIEGMPAVILEAFMFHLPVVAYGVGGIPEILTSNTGWMIAPGKTDEFVAGAVEAATNTGLRSERTSKAYDLVISNFTMKEIAARFSRIYERMVNV